MGEAGIGDGGDNPDDNKLGQRVCSLYKQSKHGLSCAADFHNIQSHSFTDLSVFDELLDYTSAPVYRVNKPIVQAYFELALSSLFQLRYIVRV